MRICVVSAEASRAQRPRWGERGLGKERGLGQAEAKRLVVVLPGLRAHLQEASGLDDLLVDILMRLDDRLAELLSSEIARRLEA